MEQAGVLNCCRDCLVALFVLAVGVFSCQIAGAEDILRQGTSEPHHDSKGRAGKWWWSHGELQGEDGGNRGRVFGAQEVTNENLTTSESPPAPPAPANLTVCGPRGPILNNVLFAPDSALLRPEGQAECNKVVKELLNYSGDTLICIGHTDNAGSIEYNRELGMRRAIAVRDYIVSRGVAGERVTILSKGEDEPAVPNDTPGDRALNRRVTFAIKIGT